jgi:hypothetical protein
MCGQWWTHRSSERLLVLMLVLVLLLLLLRSCSTKLRPCSFC